LLQLGIGKFLICRMQNFNRKAANTEETKSNFSNWNINIGKARGEPRRQIRKIRFVCFVVTCQLRVWSACRNLSRKLWSPASVTETNVKVFPMHSKVGGKAVCKVCKGHANNGLWWHFPSIWRAVHFRHLNLLTLFSQSNENNKYF